ncbi:MAG: lipid II flippase MurJ [Actinomycetaceae bacterium]|nr:lipid II flippase MurJ [Actinomycetaceae bacterium]
MAKDGSSKGRAGSLLRSSAIMASGTLVSRLLGFIKAAMMLAALGAAAGGVNAAFQTANTLPNTVFNLIAAGVLDAILVPQIVAALKRSGGQQYVNRLLTLAGLIVFVLTVAAMVLAPVLVFINATGYDEEIRALAVAFSLICLPQLFFYGVYTLLGELLNARGIFGPYMWAPVVNNVVGIAGLAVFLVLWGSPEERIEVADFTSAQFWVLAGSATLGVIAQALVLIIPMRRAGISFRPDFHFWGTNFGSASKVAGWTFANLGISQIGVLSTNNLAAQADNWAKSGNEAIAGIAAYSNSFMIFMVPQSLITLSLATAVFTRMATAVAERDNREVADTYHMSIRTITSINLLAAAILMAGAVPMMQMFLSSTSDMSIIHSYAWVLIALMPGVASTGMVLMSQRVFYAYEDAKPVFLMGIIPTMVQVIVGWTVFFTAHARWWVVGAAFAETACRLVQGVIGVNMVARRNRAVRRLDLLRSYAAYLICAGIAFLAGWGVLSLIGVETHVDIALLRVLISIVKLFVVAIVVTLTYFLAMRVIAKRESAATLWPVLTRFKVPERIRIILAARPVDVVVRVAPITADDLVALGYNPTMVFGVVENPLTGGIMISGLPARREARMDQDDRFAPPERDGDADVPKESAQDSQWEGEIQPEWLAHSDEGEAPPVYNEPPALDTSYPAQADGTFAPPPEPPAEAGGWPQYGAETPYGMAPAPDAAFAPPPAPEEQGWSAPGQDQQWIAPEEPATAAYGEQSAPEGFPGGDAYGEVAAGLTTDDDDPNATRIAGLPATFPSAQDPATILLQTGGGSSALGADLIAEGEQAPESPSSEWTAPENAGDAPYSDADSPTDNSESSWVPPVEDAPLGEGDSEVADQVEYEGLPGHEGAAAPEGLPSEHSGHETASYSANEAHPYGEDSDPSGHIDAAWAEVDSAAGHTAPPEFTEDAHPQDHTWDEADPALIDSEAAAASDDGYGEVAAPTSDGDTEPFDDGGYATTAAPIDAAQLADPASASDEGTPSEFDHTSGDVDFVEAGAPSSPTADLDETAISEAVGGTFAAPEAESFPPPPEATDLPEAPLQVPDGPWATTEDSNWDTPSWSEADWPTEPAAESEAAGSAAAAAEGPRYGQMAPESHESAPLSGAAALGAAAAGTGPAMSSPRPSSGGFKNIVQRDQDGKTLIDPTIPMLILGGILVVFGGWWALATALSPAGGPGFAGSDEADQSAPAQSAAQSAQAAPAPAEEEKPAEEAAPPPKVTSATILSWNGSGDNENEAINLIDGNPETTWHSRSYYAGPSFAEDNTVAILLKLENPAKVSEITMEMDPSTSGGLVVVKSADPNLTQGRQGTELATSPLSGKTVIKLPQPTEASAILISFREMPKAIDGSSNWAWVKEITVK